ncbi:hypothetical protein T02_15513 [Trichinella nativa]|uniref:CCHC-type domain-containing protein n=1 Tax=Trichinella nativa TaxID=6335 RepID=A0A0V1KPE9_9BILA|nr:hypothetical protein T02_15513 [Trichinella nativa]
MFCNHVAPTSATNGERGRIDGPEWVRPPEILTMRSNVETGFGHIEMYFRAARITTERRNGERGRIDGLEWVRPPEVLTMSSNVETWFEHMEMYFRAAHISPERRAALVQYHTDAEVRGVMRAMHVQETDDYDGLKSALFEAFEVRSCPERFSAEFFRRKQQQGESVRVYAGHLRWLFPKAFPGLSGAADKILLQQFKAGLSADAVKIAVLRSGTDSFAEAIEVAAREERVWRELTTLKASVSSVKADADQEDKQPAVEVMEATAAAVTTRKEVGEELAELVRQLKELLTSNTPAAAKRSLPQRRRRPEKKGSLRCWTCGGLGHISRECQASSRDERAGKVSSTDRTFSIFIIRSPEIETPIVEGSVGGVRCDMLVDTGSVVPRMHFGPNGGMSEDAAGQHPIPEVPRRCPGQSGIPAA